MFQLESATCTLSQKVVNIICCSNWKLYPRSSKEFHIYSPYDAAFLSFNEFDDSVSYRHCNRSVEFRLTLTMFSYKSWYDKINMEHGIKVPQDFRNTRSSGRRPRSSESCLVRNTEWSKPSSSSLHGPGYSGCSQNHLDRGRSELPWSLHFNSEQIRKKRQIKWQIT